MLKVKNLLMVLLMSMVFIACGGGGSDSSSNDGKTDGKTEVNDGKTEVEKTKISNLKWKKITNFKGNRVYSPESSATFEEDNVLLKAVKVDGERSAIKARAYLNDTFTNYVKASFNFEKGAKKSYAAMLVFAKVESLSDELKEEYKNLGENLSVVFVTKVWANKVLVFSEIFGDKEYKELASLDLSDGSDENVGKSFTINNSYNDDTFKISVDGIEKKFEYKFPKGMKIGKFVSVDFETAVDDRKNTASAEETVIKVTNLSSK
ncbi:MAG: hypothetical protein KGV43_00105 [Arcobacter sp.]|nr:hypothetical protein [Arcobacter sp.]